MKLRWLTVLLFALFGVAVSASLAAPPPLRMDVASPVEATSTSGASVSYHVKAYDPDSGNAIGASCTGGSGSGDFDVTVTLPLGTSNIHCDATLEDLSTASEDRSVTVQDTTSPSFSAVANVGASTTNPTTIPSPLLPRDV